MLLFNQAFNQANSFVYKYLCVSENKSVLNWTFCKSLNEKPNCTKQFLIKGILISGRHKKWGKGAGALEVVQVELQILRLTLKF